MYVLHLRLLPAFLDSIVIPWCQPLGNSKDAGWWLSKMDVWWLGGSATGLKKGCGRSTIPDSSSWSQRGVCATPPPLPCIIWLPTKEYPLWFKILTQTIGNGWQAKFNQQFSIIVCPSIYSFSEFSRAHRHLFNTKFLFSFWGDIKCAEWKNKKVLNATFTS